MPPVKMEKRAASEPPNYDSDDGDVVQVQQHKKTHVASASSRCVAPPVNLFIVTPVRQSEKIV